MCLALRASGLWLRYATLQNLIPSFAWIAPGWRAWGRNPRKGSNFAIWQHCAPELREDAEAEAAAMDMSEATDEAAGDGEGAVWAA